MSHIQAQPTPARSSRIPRFAAPALALALMLTLPSPADAYIGPGAGVALASSFMVIFTTIILAGLAVLVYPFRSAWRFIRRPKRGKAHARRMIVVGFDGQDPKLTEKFMEEGKLPNFKKLADKGCYHRLRTTYASVSPVAWSSYSTGCEPAKHNIFDFLDRDRKTYLPLLSSTHIGSVDKFFKIGKYKIPLKKPEIRLLRKSKTFWGMLGDYHIWSTVLRVPITFPPEKFYGAELSAMCTPDLLGTQGTFFLYTTRSSDEKFKEGGQRINLTRNDAHRYQTEITGPENSFLEGDPPLTIPLLIEGNRNAGTARLTIDKETVELKKGELSDWLTLSFKAAPGITVSGIARMKLTELDENLSIYMTPLNIDPENPAMPISHPSYYATYLSKKVGGHYCTLGLAEDTWALNEGVTDDGTFLEQSYDIDKEREEMFFASLDRLRTGTLTCVFDATDRIQHMFWRYWEKDHPAARGIDNPEHADAIEKIYTHNDKLIGKVLERIRDDDVLMVISDHGFASFRRGVNLNAWLLENGYLKLKEGADGKEEWLTQVDWSQTKAYSLGLVGMFLNVEGREAHGIVKPGEEADALKAELIAKLNGLRDEECDEVGITEVFDTKKLYSGPYIGNSPDMIIGYNDGYRVSWDGASGVVATPVFEDNVKAWSGDHCIDPRQVPGILFCNRAIDREDPALIDIAPTALKLFGVEPPPHMDGSPLFTGSSAGGGKVPAAASAPQPETELAKAG